MAGRGEIPKRLASLKGRCPICVACLFGQAHKRPWSSKSKQKHPICKPTDDAPGKRFLLDQMVSSQPGLIPQMSGSLTNLRIMGATVFVDHYSDHVYVSIEEMIKLSSVVRRCPSVSVGVHRCPSVSVCKEFLPRNPT